MQNNKKPCQCRECLLEHVTDDMLLLIFKNAKILDELKELLKNDALERRLAWAKGGSGSKLIEADTCDYYLDKIKELENK